MAKDKKTETNIGDDMEKQKHQWKHIYICIKDV